jgi:hypothetical protein
LRCYYSSFNKITTKNPHDYNHWITTGIRTSCKRKRELFLLCRHNNDANLKTYYKIYCKILSNVILTAKELHYKRIILNSNNKMATTWKIINHENGKPSHCNNSISLRIDKKEVNNQNKIANIFNNYFLSIADTIHYNESNINNHPYSLFQFRQFFFFCRLAYLSQMAISIQMPLKNYFCVVQHAMQQPWLSCSSIIYKGKSHISVSTVNIALKDHIQRMEYFS